MRALGFAAASWRRDDLDARRGAAAGWQMPKSGSVANDLFDDLEQRQWTGDRPVDIELRADGKSIVAVTIEFASFLDPDEDDEDEPLVAPTKPRRTADGVHLDASYVERHSAGARWRR